jgi:gliding-associated putative ABC transporter substrate-binding component GldG
VVRLVIMGLILLCVNILASYFHTGLDLTRERRFTVTEPTKALLHNMKETAVIDVYLKGKFPADLQRLQEAVREQLVSFKEIAGTKIIYWFINPMEGKSEKDQKEVVRNLQLKGINWMPLETEEEEGYSMKIFFPYALVQYNGKELPVELMESPRGKDVKTFSEALLEYKFASAINELSKPAKPRIAYVFGHNEDMGTGAIGMLGALSLYYNLDSLNLTRTIHISNAYDAIIINSPTTPFTDPEKLKIDQYIMRGGHVLIALNTMNATMDSFKADAGSMKYLSFEYGLNLDDLLFKYGVRVNNDLVEDQQCIPIAMMNRSNQAQLYNWVYFPRINPIANHPIVRNMDFIMGGFSNSIDTILTAEIKKTVLLQSSKYSRVAGSPVTISLTKLTYPGRPETFTKPYRNLAVLLEGRFHSVYENRLAPSYLHLLDSLNEPFQAVSNKRTSMIVTSVGNIFHNEVSNREGPLPLGYNRASGEYFANRSLLLNCMEYLTDRSGILEARSKDVKVRLLDKVRVKDEMTMWQWVNVGLPIFAVLVFASAFTFFRMRKYEVKYPTNTAA